MYMYLFILVYNAIQSSFFVLRHETGKRVHPQNTNHFLGPSVSDSVRLPDQPSLQDGMKK